MPALISTRWITGRGFDLAFYLGSCVTGYLLIYLHVGVGVPASLLLWFWIVSVDGPHVFGTLSRTYLDREEWRRRAPLLWGSLGWFLAGPLAFGFALLARARWPFLAFLALAQVWAYWHVVRQHYGFLVLYQKKNGERSGPDNPIDYYCFYAFLMGPFVSFLLRHPQARIELGLGAVPSAGEQGALGALHAAVAAAVVVYLAKEAFLLLRGRTWNLPKNLFLLATVPLHCLIFLHPFVSTRVDIRLFSAFVTYYHNIQYHGIVWFHNRNRYAADDAGERHGLACLVSRSVLTYYAAGVAFTLAYRYSNWFLAGVPAPLLPGPNAVSEAALGPLFTVSDLAIAFWWGFALHHYYLDQKIWKLSRDSNLARDLRLQTAGAS